jgi:hypothetical protein
LTFTTIDIYSTLEPLSDRPAGNLDTLQSIPYTGSFAHRRSHRLPVYTSCHGTPDPMHGNNPLGPSSHPNLPSLPPSSPTSIASTTHSSRKMPTMTTSNSGSGSRLLKKLNSNSSDKWGDDTLSTPTVSQAGGGSSGRGAGSGMKLGVGVGVGVTGIRPLVTASNSTSSTRPSSQGQGRETQESTGWGSSPDR